MTGRAQAAACGELRTATSRSAASVGPQPAPWHRRPRRRELRRRSGRPPPTPRRGARGPRGRPRRGSRARRGRARGTSSRRRRRRGRRPRRRGGIRSCSTDRRLDAIFEDARHASIVPRLASATADGVHDLRRPAGARSRPARRSPRARSATDDVARLRLLRARSRRSSIDSLRTSPSASIHTSTGTSPTPACGGALSTSDSSLARSSGVAVFASSPGR